MSIESAYEVLDVVWISNRRVGVRALIGDTVAWGFANVDRPGSLSDEEQLVSRIKANPGEWI